MAYKEPLATTTGFGIIKPGTSLTVLDGVLNVTPVALLNQAFFFSTSTQTNPVASTANFMSFNNSPVSLGISLLTANQIQVTKTANYNFQFTAQINKTDGGQDNIDIWIVRNGVNYPDSNTVLTLDGNVVPLIAGGWNFILSLNANDVVQVAWQSADTAMRFLAGAAQVGPSRPATSSVRCSIIQI